MSTETRPKRSFRPVKVEELPEVETNKEIKYELRECSYWRERDAAFKKATKEQLENIFYQMALDGASLVTIAKLFRVPVLSLASFQEVINRGNAELAIILLRDQIQTALQSAHPTMKIWLGKQMLSQTDGPMITAKSDEGDVKFHVQLVEVQDDKEASVLAEEQ